MPRKKSYLTAKVQFSGAGGSSIGVRSAGVEVRTAMNHWPVAVETHSLNFPDADNICVDISSTDPRRYNSSDILVTSPECTNQTTASGKKKTKLQMRLFLSQDSDAAAERSRATMWDVPRFAEYHRYNAIIVENVTEAKDWVMFDAWLHAMHSLGYKHRSLYLNSMHFHPTPQSRDRLYVVFWKKGNRAPVLDFNPVALCEACGKNVKGVQSWKKAGQRCGKYRKQYIYSCPSCGRAVEPFYYAFHNIIDWSDLGQRISDRKAPLEPTSIQRLQYGLDKYGKVSPSIGVSRAAIYDRGAVSINGFMAAYNSGGHSVKHLSQECGTQATADRFGLLSFLKPTLEDSYYRMLKEDEVQRLMAFGDDYIILGDHRQKIMQLGNAVNPPVMEWITRQIVKSLS